MTTKKPASKATDKKPTTATKPADKAPATKPADKKPANKPADKKAAPAKEEEKKPATTTKPADKKASTDKKAAEKPATGKKTESAPVAGDFVRSTYTKADVASEFASLSKLKAGKAAEMVDLVMQAMVNVASRLEVGVNEKGVIDSDILQLTGLLSIDLAFHQERNGFNKQTEQIHKIPAKFHTRISAGTVLKSEVETKANAKIGKLTKKK